jgi:hypothetical protein
MNLSPVVLDRIKKAQGRIQITEGATPMLFDLKVLENGIWTPILVNQSKAICESAVKRAGQNLIIG